MIYGFPYITGFDMCHRVACSNVPLKARTLLGRKSES